MNRWIIILSLLGACGPALAVEFERIVIDGDFPGGYQVEVADVNGDGKPDLVAVGGGTCSWYENPGWIKRIVTGPKQTPDIISSATLDIDGDGKAEIAIAHDFAMEKPRRGKLSLAFHGGNQGVDRDWMVRPVADFPSIHRLRWADVHGTGKPALIVAPIFGPRAIPPDYNQDRATIALFQPGEKPKISNWPPTQIGGDFILHAIKAGDVYGDGRVQVLAAGASGVTRFELGQKPRVWGKRVLTAGESGNPPGSGCSEVQVGRLSDGSRFLATIEPWHGNQVAVAPFGDGVDPATARTVIDSSLVEGHALWTADVDGDGDDEIFAGFRGRGTSVLMFKRAGKGWVKTVIDRDIAAQDLRGGDLDGDGTPDVVAIGGKTHNLVWYRPIRKK